LPISSVSDDWQFQVAPYLWGISADGDVTVRGQESEVDAGFSDIIDKLNYGVMIEGEARKGRIGLWGQAIYADLEDSESVLGLKIDAEVDAVWAGFGAYYRLGPWALGSEASAAGPKVIVEPYAGVRYTYLDLELDVGGGLDAERDRDWFEPIVGLRTIWEFSPRWSVTALGDIGGFGAGSDFAWQASGLIGYRFGLFGENDSRFLFGYRALSQDYDTGSGANKFEWDITLHGPIFALAIEF
jgi:hypothetical protein